ncbi:MAG: hypothetical protein H6698_07115 [Myxococcales bacterium]|nr:hypothetical protein [Myxococcales bacterium]MCB9521526.1 hypothetical protein [Myxococcales bacterium]MCB9534077.1 hypothetical protein [Myxococcales bacterium]
MFDLRSMRPLRLVAACAFVAACADDPAGGDPDRDTDDAAPDSAVSDAGHADADANDAGAIADATDARADGAPDDASRDTSDGALDDGAVDSEDCDDAADAGDAPVAIDTCAALSCGAGSCDDGAGTCACASGEWFDGYGCSEVEACSEGTACEQCPIPTTQTLTVIADAETLTFDAAGALVEVGLNLDLEAGEPSEWTAGATLSLSGVEGRRVRVFARVPGCDVAYNAVLDVRAAYPPPAGQPTSDAVALDAPGIRGWATSVIEVLFGDAVDEEWRDPSRALGPAEGTSVDIVALGRGGSIVLAFDAAIVDGPGPDLAVFENSFSDTFLELGRVSVSTDGVVFVAFDIASTSDEPVGAFGSIDATTLGQLAGSYAQGWGTPFDLATLRQRPEVRTGELDLRDVRFVRIDDVVGDGSEHDSFGRPIYDQYPTVGSAGFDLDAIAVLNQAEPR